MTNYCFYHVPAVAEKYKFARQWKVLCVRPQWLYDSIDTGYCQDEEKYSVDSKPSLDTKKARCKQEEEHKTKEPEWARLLSEFTLPRGHSELFLDGCKVKTMFL